MADLDNIPTLETIQNFNKDAKVHTEIVTGGAEKTNQLDSAGKSHYTLAYLNQIFGGINVGDYVSGTALSEVWEYAYNPLTGYGYKVKSKSSLPYPINATLYPDPEDDPNLKRVSDVNHEDVTKAQEELLPSGSQIYPRSGYLANGMTVPVTTTHLRVLIGGNTVITAMSTITSGVVASLTESGASIGGTNVLFKNTYTINYVSTEEMLNQSTHVGFNYSSGKTKWLKTSESNPEVIGNFKPLGRVYTEDFGDTYQGIVDALSVADEIRFTKGTNYTVSGSLDLDDVSIDLNGSSISAPSGTPVFSLKGGSVKISNISSVDGGLLEFDGDLDSLKLSSINYTPTKANDETCLTETAAHTIGNVEIKSCNFKDSAFSLLDSSSFGSFLVMNSSFDDCHYRLLRMLNESNGKVSFKRNSVNNLTNNGATGASGVARVMQVDANTIVVANNDVFDVKTDQAGANLIYYGFGNLRCYGNHVKNMTGDTFVIHDKGLGSSGKNYQQHVFNNTFEWDEGETDRPEGVVHTLDGRYMMCNNNTFIRANTRAMTVRKTDIATNSASARMISYKGNDIYDHDYPVVIFILNSCKLLDASGNTVYGLTNTGAISDTGLTEPSLVYACITTDVDDGNVGITATVSNNKVYNGASDSHILATNKGTVATATLKCSVDNNDLNGGNSYVFVRFQSPDRLSITNNIGETPTDVYTGTTSTITDVNNYVVTP